MILNITAIHIMGFSIGNTTYKNFCFSEAPSMEADSNKELGRASKPDKRIKIKKGVHCQKSANTTANRAVSGEDNGANVTPIFWNKKPIGLNKGLYKNFHRRPVVTRGSIMGNAMKSINILLINPFEDMKIT